MQTRTTDVLRQLSGYATQDQSLATTGRAVIIGGTSWLVPVVLADQPLGRAPIALSSADGALVADSGLTLADVERDEVVDALNAVGLGVTAEATLLGDGWYAGLEAWGLTHHAARRRLTRLVRSVPGPWLLGRLGGRRREEWPLGVRRSSAGYHVAAPTGELSQAMLSWTRAAGTAGVWADRVATWTDTLDHALGRLRHPSLLEAVERHVVHGVARAHVTCDVSGGSLRLDVAPVGV